MAKGPTKAQIKLYEEALKASKALGLSEDEQFKVEKQIYDQKIKTLKVLRDTIAATKTLQIEEKNRTKEQEKQKKIANENAAKKKTSNDLLNISAQLTTKLKGLEEDLVTNSAERVDKVKSLIQESKKSILQAVKSKHISMDEALILKQKIRERQKEVKGLELSRNIAGAVMNEAEEGIDSMKSRFDKFMSYIPGGGLISKALGVDAAFDQLKDQSAKAISAITSTIMKGGTAMEGLTAAQKAFNLSALANPYVLLAAVIIGTLVTVTSILMKQTKMYLDQAKAVGNSVAAAKQQVITAKELSATTGNSLSSYQDILDVQNAINESLGDSKRITAETAMEAANLGKTYGYGAKTAGESTAAFMNLGASQEESIKIQRQTNVEALKAGVDMGKVQKDIAKNSKQVSKYLSGDPEALAAAAVEAAKLGTDLAQMAKIADGLLDIESSMQAQFEFQAMTGKQINLNKARELSLAGDIAGATKEMMKQVGDINDFEKMNVAQRGKLAKMMGMEVSEIEKSLRLQEFRGKLDDDQIAKLSGMNLSAAELKNLTAEEAEQKLKSVQATEQMKTAFAKLKQTIMNALQPLFDVVGMIIENLLPVFNIIGTVLKVAFLPIKMAFEVFKQIQEVLQPIKDSLNGLKGPMGLIGSAADGIFDVFKSIIKFALTPISIIIKAIAGVVGIIVGAFSKMAGLIKKAGNLLLNTLLLPLKPFMWLFDKIFGGGGGGTEGAAATTQSMAKGGTAKGGLTLVGERGPELVQLPKGANVAPAGPTSEFIKSDGSINKAEDGVGGAIQAGADMKPVIAVLKAILAKVGTPASVVIGDSQIAQISSITSAKKSFI